MIEQVLYRRTAEQGYNEYCSRGLSKEEAHRINIVMDAVASDIGNLGSGADSPFMFYPFDSMERFCLATFQREFSRGRSNSVNHGLLIADSDYKELVKDPEQIWGFTNRNFLSRRVNHREEMFTLRELEVSRNPELNKDFIFEEYNLNNKGYLTFLSAIYTSLSKNKNYSCGIRIDSSKDANKVMRHMGYLIMCMLPYELRNKFSCCSRTVPDSIKVTVQILQEKDSGKTDIVYDMNTCECRINNSVVEIVDFYLKDLLSMSDAALREYFEILTTFKDNLNLSESSDAEYVVSKLLQLSQNPEFFGSETAEKQFAFIDDVFSLPTSNNHIIHSIVVRLLPFVDSNHYMKTFNINFELYRKLDFEKESDRKIMMQIEDNLTQNYLLAADEERAKLFKSVFHSVDTGVRMGAILENFIESNDICSDSMLVDEYIELYEEFFETKWNSTSTLYKKISAVFKRGDISEKKRIWERMYNSTKSRARIVFISGILREKDERFYSAIFDTLVSLYIEIKDDNVKKLIYTRICDVLREQDDIFRLQVLCKYKDSVEVENSLWIDAYNSMNNLQRMSDNTEFVKCLRHKYYYSENPVISNLYIEYISHASISELEGIIHQYGKTTDANERDDLLISKVVYYLTRDRKKVSVDTLKILASVIKDKEANELAVYISSLYLQSVSDESNEIYDYLETEQVRLFNSSFLHKESLPSFDYYYALKLDKRVLNDDRYFVNTLKYLEGLQYHEESFSRISTIYQQFIEQEFAILKNDYERFLKYKELITKLNVILGTKFANQYYSALKNCMQYRFWNESCIDTFDYEHCDMYKTDSEIYDQMFVNHENHILADNIHGLLNDSFVDWDKAYGFLLTKKYITKDSVRNQIVNDLKKRYLDCGMDVSDADYIAFVSVNALTLDMDYTMLFDELQKHGYPINHKNISRMKVFSYIEVNMQLMSLIKKYKNYQSDNPSYGEVIRGLLIEQIAVVGLLLANNIFKTFAINMYDDLKTRNMLLLVNYAGYIGLIVIVGVISLLLMRRANLRRSTIYDKYVFGLLIVNLICTSVAVILSARLTSIIVSSTITILVMILVIILNIKSISVIGKTGKKAMRRGDDIYE